MRSPHTALERGPNSPQREKSQCSNADPAQPKINRVIWEKESSEKMRKTQLWVPWAEKGLWKLLCRVLTRWPVLEKFCSDVLRAVPAGSSLSPRLPAQPGGRK